MFFAPKGYGLLDPPGSGEKAAKETTMFAAVITRVVDQHRPNPPVSVEVRDGLLL